MELTKRYKCVHCGSVVECSGDRCSVSCSCNKVKTNMGILITEGQEGIDYIDVTPKLLLG